MNIEQLREFCLSLPATSEGIKYGDQLCFMVAGKAFCSSNIKNLDRVSFRVLEEEFEELCDRPGIQVAPYGGARFHCVQVTDFDCLEAQEWTFYLRQAYEMAKARLPGKVRETLAD